MRWHPSVWYLHWFVIHHNDPVLERFAEANVIQRMPRQQLRCLAAQPHGLLAVYLCPLAAALTDPSVTLMVRAGINTCFLPATRTRPTLSGSITTVSWFMAVGLYISRACRNITSLASRDLDNVSLHTYELEFPLCL